MEYEIVRVDSLSTTKVSDLQGTDTLINVPYIKHDQIVSLFFNVLKKCFFRGFKAVTVWQWLKLITHEKINTHTAQVLLDHRPIIICLNLADSVGIPTSNVQRASILNCKSRIIFRSSAFLECISKEYDNRRQRLMAAPDATTVK